jgi:large subunit ribosomal protein L35
MARCEAPSKQLLRSLRRLSITPKPQDRQSLLRTFSTTLSKPEEAEVSAPQKPSFRRNPDPELVSSRRLERKLVRAHNPPIGSRRRRVVLQNAQGIPFEQLPYQCFQEARKILIADREEKVKKIEADRAKIVRLRETDPAQCGGEHMKEQRLREMARRLDHLKILADINDPLVKRRFEDGLGKRCLMARI